MRDENVLEKGKKKSELFIKHKQIPWNCFIKYLNYGLSVNISILF